MEEWREIPGTLYSVSSEGQVASRWFGKWRMLKPWRNSRGYMQVFLCDGDGGRGNVTVHTLVAKAFLGPRPTPSHQANHIDGVKANNHANNLEWCTPSENQRHRRDVLKHGNDPRGEANGATKTTEAEVREIRIRRATGEKLTSLASAFGVSLQTVCDIAKRRTWAWLK